MKLVNPFNKPTRQELAEIARRAASIIEQRGFHQGGYAASRAGTGAVCHNGALALALGSSPWAMNNMAMRIDEIQVFLRVDQACTSYLCRQGYGDDMKDPLGDYRTHLWNDMPGRTAEDVILLFKNVARELESA